ncbi:MAG: divalent-cation tolerance protein CutA [Sphingobium sp.]|nr:divalent-cation tolerance protein CutA [Sphingobium sp.]
MKEIAFVYVTFGDRDSAERAAAAMIERRLAACANVQSSCLSIYVWQGETERSEEVPVLFKTSLARRAALIAALAEAHDYELPAISSWEAVTSDGYADWVEAGSHDAQ